MSNSLSPEMTTLAPLSNQSVPIRIRPLKDFVSTSKPISHSEEIHTCPFACCQSNLQREKFSDSIISNSTIKMRIREDLNSRKRKASTTTPVYRGKVPDVIRFEDLLRSSNFSAQNVGEPNEVVLMEQDDLRLTFLSTADDMTENSDTTKKYVDCTIPILEVSKVHDSEHHQSKKSQDTFLSEPISRYPNFNQQTKEGLQTTSTPPTSLDIQHQINSHISSFKYIKSPTASSPSAPITAKSISSSINQLDWMSCNSSQSQLNAFSSSIPNLDTNIQASSEIRRSSTEQTLSSSSSSLSHYNYHLWPEGNVSGNQSSQAPNFTVTNAKEHKEMPRQHYSPNDDVGGRRDQNAKTQHNVPTTTNSRAVGNDHQIHHHMKQKSIEGQDVVHTLLPYASSPNLIPSSEARKSSSALSTHQYGFAPVGVAYSSHDRRHGNALPHASLSARESSPAYNNMEYPSYMSSKHINNAPMNENMNFYRSPEYSEPHSKFTLQSRSTTSNCCTRNDDRYPYYPQSRVSTEAFYRHNSSREWFYNNIHYPYQQEQSYWHSEPADKISRLSDPKSSTSFSHHKGTPKVHKGKSPSCEILTCGNYCKPPQPNSNIPLNNFTHVDATTTSALQKSNSQLWEKSSSMSITPYRSPASSWNSSQTHLDNTPAYRSYKPVGDMSLPTQKYPAHHQNYKYQSLNYPTNKSAPKENFPYGSPGRNMYLQNFIGTTSPPDQDRWDTNPRVSKAYTSPKSSSVSSSSSIHHRNSSGSPKSLLKIAPSPSRLSCIDDYAVEVVPLQIQKVPSKSAQPTVTTPITTADNCSQSVIIRRNSSDNRFPTNTPPRHVPSTADLSAAKLLQLREPVIVNTSDESSDKAWKSTTSNFSPRSRAQEENNAYSTQIQSNSKYPNSLSMQNDKIQEQLRNPTNSLDTGSKSQPEPGVVSTTSSEETSGNTIQHPRNLVPSTYSEIPEKHSNDIRGRKKDDDSMRKLVFENSHPTQLSEYETDSRRNFKSLAENEFGKASQKESSEEILIATGISPPPEGTITTHSSSYSQTYGSSEKCFSIAHFMPKYPCGKETDGRESREIQSPTLTVTHSGRDSVRSSNGSSPPVYDHVILLDKRVKTYMCKRCLETLKSDQEILNHLFCKMLKNSVQCHVCRNFFTNDQYPTHLRVHDVA